MTCRRSPERRMRRVLLSSIKRGLCFPTTTIARRRRTTAKCLLFQGCQQATPPHRGSRSSRQEEAEDVVRVEYRCRDAAHWDAHWDARSPALPLWIQPVRLAGGLPQQGQPVRLAGGLPQQGRYSVRSSCPARASNQHRCEQSPRAAAGRSFY